MKKKKEKKKDVLKLQSRLSARSINTESFVLIAEDGSDKSVNELKAVDRLDTIDDRRYERIAINTHTYPVCGGVN